MLNDIFTASIEVISDHFCCVTRKRAEERIVIGFRGSATIKDFLVDATAFTRKPEELQFGSKMGYVPEDMKVSIHMGFNGEE